MCRSSGIRAGGALRSALLLACSPRSRGPGAAHAQGTLVVTTTEDGGDGTCDATCTLRDAVAEATGQDSLHGRAEGRDVRADPGRAGARGRLHDPGRRIPGHDDPLERRGPDRVRRPGQPHRRQRPGGQRRLRAERSRGRRAGWRLPRRRGVRAAPDHGRRWRTTSRTPPAAASRDRAAARSTVSYNGAGTQAGPAQGGGIHVESTATSRDSTVVQQLSASTSRRAAASTRHVLAEHVTIAGNRGGRRGLFQARPTGEPMSMHNTLLAGNLGPACGGTPGIIVESNNLSDDTTCDLEGDLEGVNPGILGLDDHGGPTDRRLRAPERRVDADDDRCLRGPTGARRTGRIDIGAVERRPVAVVNERDRRRRRASLGSRAPSRCSCCRRATAWSSAAARSRDSAERAPTALVANGGHRVLSVGRQPLVPGCAYSVATPAGRRRRPRARGR